MLRVLGILRPDLSLSKHGRRKSKGPGTRSKAFSQGFRVEGFRVLEVYVFRALGFRV